MARTSMESSGSRSRRRLLGGALLLGAASATAAVAGQFDQWSAPVSAEKGSSHQLNTAANEGCPIMSPDGLDLYFASTRPGGLGGIDIWVAHRPTVNQGWGAPANPGAPINSAADDFCPTPARGHRLFFVSKREEPNGDIYVATMTRGAWGTPVHLGANVNSSAQEWSPSVYKDKDGHEILYFSSTRTGGPGGQDIYYSVDYGPAQLVPGLNTEFDDARPNVRHDGREIVFDSTRTGTLGGPDLWTAKRPTEDAPWGRAIHLTELSSPAPDTRATLSWDGTYLLFGSARTGSEGEGDLYVATRSRTASAPDAK